MKKVIWIALLFAACKPANHDGIYVNHTDGQYSLVDDTLTLKDTVIVNRTGYQKIRDGITLPKNYKVRSWSLHSPDAPPMIISGNQITIGSTIYTKLP